MLDVGAFDAKTRAGKSDGPEAFVCVYLTLLSNSQVYLKA